LLITVKNSLRKYIEFPCKLDFRMLETAHYNTYVDNPARLP
jgi:hypothetical protein